MMKLKKVMSLLPFLYLSIVRSAFFFFFFFFLLLLIRLCILDKLFLSGSEASSGRTKGKSWFWFYD